MQFAVQAQSISISAAAGQAAAASAACHSHGRHDLAERAHGEASYVDKASAAQTSFSRLEQLPSCFELEEQIVG